MITATLIFTQQNWKIAPSKNAYSKKSRFKIQRSCLQQWHQYTEAFPEKTVHMKLQQPLHESGRMMTCSNIFCPSPWHISQWTYWCGDSTSEAEDQLPPATRQNITQSFQSQGKKSDLKGDQLNLSEKYINKSIKISR